MSKLQLSVSVCLVLAVSVLVACDDDDIMTPNGAPEDGTPVDADAVGIDDFSFNPDELMLEPGDSLRWENHGGETHTVTINGVNESGDLQPGESFSFEFDRAGRHHVLCDYHPDMTMTITVS